jgi:hypothetical protein
MPRNRKAAKQAIHSHPIELVEFVRALARLAAQEDHALWLLQGGKKRRKRVLKSTVFKDRPRKVE